jgi:hypothetical protein
MNKTFLKDMDLIDLILLVGAISLMVVDRNGWGWLLFMFCTKRAFI